MEDKKGMHTCNDGPYGCSHCSDYWVGKHYHLARMLLYLAILLFTFWIGLALGELKGYLKYAPFDGGYNPYPIWMMRSNNYRIPNPMMGVTPGVGGYEDIASSPSPSPAPRKK